MKPNIASLCVGLLLASALGAATLGATVSGFVVNESTGQPVRGATARFESTDVEASSDLEGLILVDLPPGDYAVVVSKDAFETQRVTGIAVTASGGEFAVALKPAKGAADGAEGTGFSEQITVEAEALGSGEAALLSERKNKIEISDSIGAAEMSKTTGSDAAGVLQRVTGLSLQDSKYVFVRGLGDRYSSTSLNGSKIPSTEFEKKVVPLDLFPAGLIEKISVSKSYTADKPGDFAAGLVELSTVEFPSRQNASIGISGSWNSVTTGEPWFEYPGGIDFFGGGGQGLPDSIPPGDLVRYSPFSGKGYSAEDLEAFGEALIGDWRPAAKSSAPIDGSFKATYGNTFGKLGFVVTGTYENKVGTRAEDRTFFRLGSGGVIEPDNDYHFDYSEQKVRQALTASLAYRLADNHHIQLKSLTTSLSEGEGRYQTGFFSDISADIQDYRSSYLDQDIASLQLSGDHYFDRLGGGGLLEWRASSSSAKTGENRREAMYILLDGVATYSSDSQSGFMYWNDLQDDVTDVKVDWSSFFNGDAVDTTLKAGLAYTANDRDFAGRRLRYFTRGANGIDFTLPPEELFTAENIRPNGFEIEEATRATDTYSGTWDIPAAYAQVDVGWGRWRLVGGVRLEDSDQQVVTLDRNSLENPPIVTEIAQTDVLPSLSVVYKLGDRTNLRFAASQTVNRPEYRELAPFEFSHIVGGFTVVGNPELKRAKITSLDARWEWFPSADEVLAASLFWKGFEDPIEALLLGGSLTFETFNNVEKARNQGLELEARKHLGHHFTTIFNYAWVDSQITIDPDVSAVTNDKRALVGQPDNILNLIGEWADPNSGTTVRLLYNFVDDKVAFAGGFGLPDVIEGARSTVDVVLGQDLDAWAPGLRIKLSASNLFDADREWTQGGQTWRVYDPGRSISVSLAYDLAGH